MAIAEIEQNYQKLFGKAGDASGIGFWDRSGLTGDKLTTEMTRAAQEHGRPVLPQGTPVAPAIPSSISPEIEQNYQKLFGRASDVSGANFWANSGLTGRELTTEMAKAATEHGKPFNPETGHYEAPASKDLFQPDLVPKSTSSSGLPEGFTSDLLSKLLPELTGSFADLPGQIDEWTEKNLASSASASKNLLDGHMTNLLADLAKRGVGGTAAEGAMADVGMQAARGQTAADLAILGQGAQQKFQVPGQLASIAGLGQRSESEQTDPLAPYRLYSQMLLGMM